MKTTTLPQTVPPTIPSSSGLMGADSIIKAVPDIIKSISSIVDSNNNRDVRIAEINKKYDAEKMKIEKFYQAKDKDRAFAAACIKMAFESENFSGNDIVKLMEVYFNAPNHYREQ